MLLLSYTGCPQPAMPLLDSTLHPSLQPTQLSPSSTGRMQVRSLFLLLVLILVAATAEAGKNKKGEGQPGAGGQWGRVGHAPLSLQRAPTPLFCTEKTKKDGSKCEDWRWGPCVPNSKDCGLGFREGTCKGESKKLKCKIPCNWKKKFGGEYMEAGTILCWVTRASVQPGPG